MASTPACSDNWTYARLIDLVCADSDASGAQVYGRHSVPLQFGHQHSKLSEQVSKFDFEM
jgi:hypothetical protein